MASSQTYSLISQFSTCELSDALVKLGFPTEFLIPDIRRMSHYEGSESERICGPAYTVKMVLATDEEAPKLTEHFVDTVIDGSVVVVDAPPRMSLLNFDSKLKVRRSNVPVPLIEVKNAVWGGLMTAGAQYRGAKAVVINGRVRDLGEHKDARFAVFARGNSTMVHVLPFVTDIYSNCQLLGSNAVYKAIRGASTADYQG